MKDGCNQDKQQRGTESIARENMKYLEDCVLWI